MFLTRSLTFSSAKPESLTDRPRRQRLGKLIVLCFTSGVVNSGLLSPTWGQSSIAVPSETRTTSASYTYYPSGKLKTETAEPGATSPGGRLDSAYEYDSRFGNLTKVIATGWNGESAQDRSTTTSFNANGRFPTATQNAQGHSEQREFDARFGLVNKLVSPNGVTTKWEYDGLGRKIKESRGLASSAATEFTDYTEWRYELCAERSGGCPSSGGVSPVLVVTTNVVGSNSTKLAPTNRSYRDRLNREIRLETEGLAQQILKSIYTDTVYNDLGQVLKTSFPYFSDQTPQWTTFAYDALGRKAAETAPNGVITTTSYSALQTRTTVYADGGERTRVVSVNGIGQSSEIVDAYNRATSFIYDANGNLTHTIDPYGTTSVSGYDARGRKTSLVDPDLGSWSYIYNSFGELVKQTDAKGQVTTLGYDKIGRIVRRVEPDLTTEYLYDSVQNGVGKLARATTDNGYCRAYAYDTLSRPILTRIDIGGTAGCSAPTESFSTSETYDSAGRPDTKRFPTGVTLKNTYNATLGFLETVSNNTGGTAGAVYWRRQEGDASGRWTKMILGNRVSTLKVYDQQTMRLSNIYSGSDDNPAFGNVQYSSYIYDGVGNLTMRTDRFQLPNLVEKSQHDLLGRLTSYARYDAQGNSEVAGTRVSLTYDAVGNIKSKSDVGTYYYSPPGAASVRPHAVLELRGAVNASYRYDDANGNMTGGFDRAMAYTSFNMVRELSNANTCHRFIYQSEHQRVEQSIYNVKCASASGANLVSKTLYLHPDGANGLGFEREVKAGAVSYKHFISAGDMVVGVLTTSSSTVTSSSAGDVTYFHYDHLGSIAALSGASGVLEAERRSFDPWGKPRQADGSPTNGELPNGLNATSDRGFTLHEHLEGLSLVNMNGRIYDFAIGRFITPDPVVQDPNDAQSYNRYAYVMNRPLNSTDPTGFEGEWAGLCTACYSTGGFGSGLSFSIPTAVNQFGLVGLAPSLIGNGVTLTATQRIGLSSSYNNFQELQNFQALPSGSSYEVGSVAAKGAEPTLTERGVSLGLDFTPVVGAGKSFVQLLTGKDAVTGEETSRLMEAGGLFFGLVPGGKALLKGEKALELGTDLAKAATSLEKVAARNGGELVEGGAKFATRRDARQAASEMAGSLGSNAQAIRMREFKQSNVPWGLKDSDRVIGRRSSDGLAGWRDDFLGHPQFNMGPHVNVWTNAQGFHFFY